MKSNWQTVRLNECCEFIRGVSFQNGDAQTNAEAGFIPLLRAGNIANSLDLENDLLWIPERLTAHEQKLQKGDIAICLSSGSPQVVGKTAQLKQDWTGTVGAFCGIVRPGKSVDSEYIGHWFRSPHFINWRNAKARGANIQNLRFQELAELDISLPSTKDEQRRIAARLREQMAEVERARAAVQAQLDAAQSLPAALLRAVFTSPAAQRWPRRRISDLVASPLRTGLSKSAKADSPWRCLSLSSVRNGKLIMDAAKPVDVTAREADANQVRAGAFYVVRGNGNLKLVARGALAPQTVSEPILFPDLLIEVNPDAGKILPLYLRWAWDSAEVRTVLEDRARTSAGIYKINLTNLAAIEIPLPPRAEQQKIATRLEAELTAARSLVESLETRLAEIELLPAALLREAFSGKV
jgi:type I restriction enzyme, S subunit